MNHRPTQCSCSQLFKISELVILSGAFSEILKIVYRATFFFPADGSYGDIHPNIPHMGCCFEFTCGLWCSDGILGELPPSFLEFITASYCLLQVAAKLSLCSNPVSFLCCAMSLVYSRWPTVFAVTQEKIAI